MVKYLSFHNSSSFALTYLWMWMARPQCDTPLVLCIWTPRNAFFQVCLFVRCAEWARKKTKLLCNFGRRWVGNFEVCFVKFSFFFFFFSFWSGELIPLYFGQYIYAVPMMNFFNLFSVCWNLQYIQTWDVRPLFPTTRLFWQKSVNYPILISIMKSASMDS
jgi:hypothetical protein